MVLTARKNTYLFFAVLFVFQLSACAQFKADKRIKTAADQMNLFLKRIKGKKVAVVANQTSVISKTVQTVAYDVDPETGDESNPTPAKSTEYVHLVDSLMSLNIDVKKVFAPEHGFRGKADAGEVVKDGIDTKTNLPIVSLYGKNKKPSKDQLKDIDVILFDIQDVGARFYTYISTLHYVMEAAAESEIPVIILDRPNPNAHYIDGPVLDMQYKSFVGMHPVPVVYGMTIGEYGQMINGEKWLANDIKADLTVIPLKNYTHESRYSLPIKPSPNLPNDKAINLYPSLCFFEGTNVSAGRGTNMQFQIYGSPYLNDKNPFSFTPSPNDGAKYPKHAYMICYGEDLSEHTYLERLDLTWILKARKENTTRNFFNAFFTKLAGTTTLQIQIEDQMSEENIRNTWQKGINDFKKIRAKYLIYD